MSEIDEMAVLPDDFLNSIVGGTLTDYERYQFRTATGELKERGVTFDNAMGYFRMQASSYFSDEEWQEIEDIVRSVYNA